MFQLRLVLFCILFVVRAHVLDAADAPVVNALYPAGGQRGTEVAIEFIGSISTWPLSCSCDSDELKIEIDEAERTRAKITIQETARPGVHWLRLHGEYGATRLRPFVVETVTEIREEELGSKLVDISEPRVINGRLTKKNEVDEFVVHLQQGQTLAASVNAHRFLGTPMDCVMQIYDTKHEVVLRQIDDAPGRDPRCTFVAPHEGEFHIRLFAFPETPTQQIEFAGRDDFVYRLSISTRGMLNYVVPLALSSPNASVHVAGPDLVGYEHDRRDHLFGFEKRCTIFRKAVPGWWTVPVVEEASMESQTSDTPHTLPLLVTGCLSSEQDSAYDSFRLWGEKDQKLRVDIKARSLGMMLDPVVAVFDAEGNKLKSVDDSQGRDCQLDFVVPKDGTYEVRVEDLHRNRGDEFVYLVSVKELAPDFKLHLPSGTFTMAQGESLKLTIEVERIGGFDEPISIGLLSLPPAVSVAGATSTMEHEGGSKVELELTAKEACQGGFRVVGVSAKTNTVRIADFASVVADTRLHDAWLTVKAPEAADKEAEEDD